MIILPENHNQQPTMFSQMGQNILTNKVAEICPHMYVLTTYHSVSKF